MENEQADEAVQSMQAVPVEGAGNRRERAMSSILDQMTGEKQSPLAAEEVAGNLADSVSEAVTSANDGEALAAAAAENADTGMEADSEPQDGAVRAAKGFRGRWDHLNEQERRVVELATKKGLTLAESYRAVYGSEGAESLPSAGVGQAMTDDASNSAVTVVELDAQLNAQQARLAELKRQKAQAQADNNLGAYDEATEAYLEARDQLRDLKGQRRAAATAEAERTAEVRQRAEAVAQAAVGEEFPEALTPGTELHEACAEELAYLRESNSPLINDPQVQYKIARRMARALGYPRFDLTQNPETMQTSNQPHAAGVASASAKPGAITPKRTVRPVPAGGTPVEAPLMTLERRVAGARSSLAMLDLMREVGTPFEALLKKG